MKQKMCAEFAPPKLALKGHGALAGQVLLIGRGKSLSGADVSKMEVRR